MACLPLFNLRRYVLNFSYRTLFCENIFFTIGLFYLCTYLNSNIVSGSHSSCFVALFVPLTNFLSPYFHPYISTATGRKGRRICCTTRSGGHLPFPPLNVVVLLPYVTSCLCDGVEIRGVSAAMYTLMSSLVGICVVFVHFRTCSIASLFDFSSTFIPTILPLPSVSTLRG